MASKKKRFKSHSLGYAYTDLHIDRNSATVTRVARNGRGNVLEDNALSTYHKKTRST